MKRNRWYTNALMAAVAVTACVGLVTCGGPDDSGQAIAPQDSEGPQTRAPQSAAAPAAQPEAAPTAAAEGAPAAADDLEKPPAAEADGEPLTAETLTGTSWLVGGIYRLSLLPDGKAKLAAREGTWTVEGTTLKLSSGDDKYEAEIRGGTLYFEDKPLKRVE